MMVQCAQFETSRTIESAIQGCESCVMNKTEFNIVLSTEPPRTTPSVIHSHIPVPRVSAAIKAQERCPPKRRGSFERLGRGSVAAQRASFEKLEASVVQLRSRNNNQLSTSSIEVRGSEEKTTPVSNYKTSDVFKLNRDNSFIETKWKNKYEDSEKRRKLLLQKSEAVNKEHADLEKKYQQLHRENSTLQSQVEEKEHKLLKLRTVSEAVCKEYEQLKRQYDVETNAMHKAMQQASQWYRQNRELKRRSQIIAQKFLHNNSEQSLDFDLSDEVDNQSFEDLDELRQMVKELSSEVARLQTELHSARLQEFEAQEQVTQLTTQLEEERALRQKGEEKINEMKFYKGNMERVTKMVTEEVQALKTQCDRERENAKILKIEAEKVQKERNVLAHQSALLMAEIGDDPNGRLLAVLQEVESLKRLLEEEQQNHASQVQILQEKLEEKESNVEFEIVEEKLKLAESELEVVLQRAERAEKAVEELENVVRCLKQKVNELEEKVSKPPPPPLPPPPPPLPISMAGQSSIKLLTREKLISERSAVSDMENILGIAPKKTPAVAQPAIDDIINQIKGGRFTLKHTDKQREEERKRRQAENTSPAVSEMLNILGTMRRRAKPIRQSFKFADASS
ncbi:shootin-1 isoform X1 [Formica exsecta]|uniref:shootin-1 isoform X1 n=2 Tax=Formica exsecta TaxID=72781 RepID=UPI001141FC2D|nr:shootin-1 isoform X1 [Formica exsecta]